METLTPKQKHVKLKNRLIMRAFLRMFEGTTVAQRTEYSRTGWQEFLSLSPTHKPVRNCQMEVDSSLHAGGYELGVPPGYKKRSVTWAAGFACALDVPAPQDATFTEILRYLKSRENVIIKDYGKQNIKIFPENRRGNAAYQKKMGSKIIDALTFGTKMCPETLFLTITCDPAQHNNSKIQAWLNFPKEVGRVCKELKRKHRAEYVEVRESTLQGYPHAHIMLMFPAGTVKGYGKMRNNTPIKFGAIAATIRKFRTAKIFDLKCVKGDNVIYYMSKYISKGFDELSATDFYKSSEDAEKIKKMIYALVMSVKTGKRLFNMTRALSDKVKENQMLYALGLTGQKEDFSATHAATKSQMSAWSSDKFFQRENWADIVRAKMQDLPDRKLFNAPKRFRSIAEDILSKRISDCLSLADTVLRVWQDPFPSEEDAGLARLSLIQICNNLPDCSRARKTSVPFVVAQSVMRKDRRECFESPGEFYDKTKDFAQPTGCRGCFLRDFVSLILGTFPGIFATSEQLADLAAADDLSWFLSVRALVNEAINNIEALNVGVRRIWTLAEPYKQPISLAEKRKRAMGKSIRNQAFRLYREQVCAPSGGAVPGLSSPSEPVFPGSVEPIAKGAVTTDGYLPKSLEQCGITREILDDIV